MNEFKPQACSLCGRARALNDPEHQMDSYDYNPMQVLSKLPVGWYSGDDGEVCPEDMEKSLKG